jgi:replication fork protection complex subunit Csm3/Swi3
MPSATKPAAQASKQDDLDNYLVGNLSDDPFASPSPESSQKKRKANDGGLGIDEEVNVQKRARAPAVKLDEDRYACMARQIKANNWLTWPGC